MLAVLEYREGNCADATTHFEKAGEVIRSQIDGLNAFGTCLVQLKKLDQAESVFGQALTLRPEDRRERHLLASLEIMTRKPQEALATLKPLLDDTSFHGGPLLEQIVLRVHSLRDKVSPTLKDHLPIGREVDVIDGTVRAKNMLSDSAC